jgi:hypothetical protein
MFRTRVILSATLTALLLMAVPALAQDYPPEDAEPAVTVGQTEVRPGEAFRVCVEDFQPGSTFVVTLVQTGDVIGNGTVGADGTGCTQATIPAGTAPGDYTVRVTGIGADGSTAVLDTTITVVGEAAAAPVTPAVPGGLARTGGLLTTGGALAILFLVIGAGAIFAGRRLNRQQTA